ncbi:hypothetical protein Q3W71_15385 [Micromonospora sp. C28SCA-DRY-2]|uniref:hypothetical protein n=1 Tax=Micromonospora sp. C28SCA-DRY-2 TaxID=3059522 RepID=UPI0026767466|nr:hypothetical protein [Micromonospora sp. C28SCA-DRY-2]MDO3703053.1 hypothetical protein [Micromonospora sp. C28SCA-DRY-2]
MAHHRTRLRKVDRQPATAAAQAPRVVTDLTVTDGVAGPLLLAATGRRGLPAGFSVR